MSRHVMLDIEGNEIYEDEIYGDETYDDEIHDSISSPPHYKLEGLDIESIEVIQAVLGVKGFDAFCRGNALKYLIRADKKNGIEDLKKARVYLEWEIGGLKHD
jgi:hypothetical protein